MKVLGPTMIAALAATAAADPAPCANGKACYALGRKLEPTAAGRALKAFDRGCALRHSQSCVAAGYVLREGKLGKPDVEGSHRYFAAACNIKDIAGEFACGLVGNDLAHHIGSSGDPAKDLRLANELFAKTCDSGSGDSCYNLGVSLRDGLGIRADLKRAYAAFERACKLDSAGGCRAQGLALVQGDGVAVDLHRAFTLFEKACNGDASECLALAVAYKRGDGVAADLVRARALFDKACDANEATSCYLLALMIAGGEGGPTDDALAHEKLAKACAGGFKKACD